MRDARATMENGNTTHRNIAVHRDECYECDVMLCYGLWMFVATTHDIVVVVVVGDSMHMAHTKSIRNATKTLHSQLE